MRGGGGGGAGGRGGGGGGGAEGCRQHIPPSGEGLLGWRWLLEHFEKHLEDSDPVGTLRLAV